MPWPELTARERRRTRRYPIRLPLGYRVTEGAEGNGGQTGQGETCDISSKGILFAADPQPPAGSVIDLTLHWPVRIGDGMPIRLVVSGPILRCDARGVVLLVKRYYFFAEPSP